MFGVDVVDVEVGCFVGEDDGGGEVDEVFEGFLFGKVFD